MCQLAQGHWLQLFNKLKFCCHIDVLVFSDSLFPFQERRLHGVSSLSQDLNGVFLSASCMDNRYSTVLISIYMS